MKFIYLSIVLFAVFNDTAFAQVQYVSPINPQANDLIIDALKTRTAIYEKNRNSIRSLLKWIGELKAKETDSEFISGINIYQNKLQRLLNENKDLALETNNIILIENDINDEISKYNQRVAAANKKYDDENSPNKIFELGVYKYKNNDINGAIVYFKKMTELVPDFAGGHFYAGLCYYEQGNYNAAILYLNKSINLDPLPEAYNYKGWAEYYSKNYIQAIQDFTLQIEKSSLDDPIGYYNRGSAKLEVGDLYGAISDYQKAISIKPNFSMAYNNLGWVYYVKNQYIDALKCVNKSIELDSTNSIALDSRAEIKFNMKDYNGSILDCNKSLQINPKLANSYFIRGRALYKLGKKSEACQDWSLAGQFGKIEAYNYISKYCK